MLNKYISWKQQNLVMRHEIYSEFSVESKHSLIYGVLIKKLFTKSLYLFDIPCISNTMPITFAQLPAVIFPNFIVIGSKNSFIY